MYIKETLYTIKGGSSVQLFCLFSERYLLSKERVCFPLGDFRQFYEDNFCGLMSVCLLTKPLHSFNNKEFATLSCTRKKKQNFGKEVYSNYLNLFPFRIHPFLEGRQKKFYRRATLTPFSPTDQNIPVQTVQNQMRWLVTSYLIRIYTICHSGFCFDFIPKPLFTSMDMS